MTNTSKPPNSGGNNAAAKPASPHSRFIPREELQSFAAWNPGAIGGGQAGAAASPRAGAGEAAPPPTPEQQRAAMHAARQSGYQDGYRDGLVALDAFKQSYASQMSRQIGALVASFDAQIGALEAQMADALAKAAAALARQVVRQELSTHPELVARVAREAVAQLLLTARHVTIQLHPDDLPLVAEGAADEIERRGARLQPNPAIARGGCVIESDSGAIDAGIEGRWRRAASALGDDSELGSLEDEALVLRESGE